MSITFVYRPKSGDRVFAERPTDELVILHWHNGCRHIVGDHKVVTVSAANPGDWWRNDAKRMASELVDALGGVAWDTNGEISVAVPDQHAATVWVTLRFAECRKPGFRLDQASMADIQDWKSGILHLVISDEGPKLVAKSETPARKIAGIRIFTSEEVKFDGEDAHYIELLPWPKSSEGQPWTLEDVQSLCPAERVEPTPTDAESVW